MKNISITISVFFLQLTIAVDTIYDYELGLRVLDNLASLTREISFATNIPLQTINNKGINLDVNKSYEIGYSLLYVITKLSYKKILGIMIGFENKEYISYLSDYYSSSQKFPSGLAFDEGHSTMSSRYSVKYNGVVDKLLKSHKFDWTKTPWYLAANMKENAIWTPAFLSEDGSGTDTEGIPVVAFSAPIINSSSSGSRQWLGVLSTTVPLVQISQQLKSNYGGSNRHVFIVERPTNTLIASSMDAALVTTTTLSSNSHRKTLLSATQSENPLIAGATHQLIGANWPTYLGMFQSYYLQTYAFEDNSASGLNWTVVMLVDTAVDVDHLGAESSFYNIVFVISILMMCAAFISLLITIFFWKTRTMQLSQPVITVVCLIGAFLFGIYCLYQLGTNNSTTCISRPFLLSIAFTLGFVPYLIKSFMIYKRFVYSWNAGVLVHGGSNKLISARSLGLSLLGFFLIDIGLAATTIYSSGNTPAPYTTLAMGSNGAYSEFTYCGYLKPTSRYNMVNVIYHSFLIVLVFVLAYKTRKLSETVTGNKIALMIIYIDIFVGGVIIAILRSVRLSVPISILMQTCWFGAIVIASCIALVGPVTYKILKFGDRETADGAIDEMYETRTDGGAKMRKQSSIRAMLSQTDHQRRRDSQMIRQSSLRRQRSNEVLPAVNLSGRSGNGGDLDEDSIENRPPVYLSLRDKALLGLGENPGILARRNSIRRRDSLEQRSVYSVAFNRIDMAAAEQGGEQSSSGRQSALSVVAVPVLSAEENEKICSCAGLIRGSSGSSRDRRGNQKSFAVVQQLALGTNDGNDGSGHGSISQRSQRSVYSISISRTPLVEAETDDDIDDGDGNDLIIVVNDEAD